MSAAISQSSITKNCFFKYEFRLQLPAEDWELLVSPEELWLGAEPHLDCYVLWPGPKLFHLPVETHRYTVKTEKKNNLQELPLSTYSKTATGKTSVNKLV